MTTERDVIALEEQAYNTLDASERRHLLQAFVRDLDKLSHHAEFDAIAVKRIAALHERIKLEKELMARLKREGADTADVFFLLITLKTVQALWAEKRALARKVVVCIIPGRPS